MKNVTKTSLFLLLAGITLSSCNNDDDCKECEIDESRRIILSSHVMMGAEPRLQDDQIESGQKLSLFITPYNTTSEILYPNIEIIANGTGGFVGQSMYFPIDGRNIDFYAIHPFKSGASLTNPVNFSIETDQSSEDRYLNSDLLFATRVNRSRNDNPISMIFSHKMSKLDITIENNDGLDLGTLSSFTVSNILPSTTITINDGNITEATGAPVSINAYGVTPALETRASVSGIHAIIVPQTIPALRELFRFTVGQQTYVYTTTEEFTFLGGNKHAVKLTISAGEISITSSITPWISGGSIGGGVTPE